jgi:hypothetical protein
MPAIGGAAPLLKAKGASRPCQPSQARLAPNRWINKTLGTHKEPILSIKVVRKKLDSQRPDENLVPSFNHRTAILRCSIPSSCEPFLMPPAFPWLA